MNRYIADFLSGRPCRARARRPLVIGGRIGLLLTIAVLGLLAWLSAPRPA